MAYPRLGPIWTRKRKRNNRKEREEKKASGRRPRGPPAAEAVTLLRKMNECCRSFGIGMDGKNCGVHPNINERRRGQASGNT
jgi:hypothetical protein